MPRTHEDIERHDFVDHRPDGPPVSFAPGQWCAVEVAHVAADRVGAGISTYETLIEKARTSSARVRAAVVLRSTNERRVIALIGLDGHDSFRHLTAAWDDHHLNAERHAVAESGALTLYRVRASSGEAAIDLSSHDAYAFEHVAREAEQLGELTGAISAAAGFRGVMLLVTDDTRGSAVVYRFAHAEEIETFRASEAAVKLLGPPGATGESLYLVHPVKTFA